MKKHAIENYQNTLELQLIDSSKNNSKLYWKLLRDTFKSKSTPQTSPPLQYTSASGDVKFAFSEEDKIHVLNTYFASITCVDDEMSELPKENIECNSVFDNIFICEQEIIDILSIYYLSIKPLEKTVLAIKC